MTTSAIVSKVWAFCNTLRDDGVGYGDYLEQLTYLLFLKMADEYARPPYSRKLPIPKDLNWESLTSKSGDELETHYSRLLREPPPAKPNWLATAEKLAAPVSSQVATPKKEGDNVRPYLIAPKLPDSWP